MLVDGDVPNKQYLVLLNDISMILEMEQIAKSKRIEATTKLFSQEIKQVHIIISLLFMGKNSGHLLGMNLDEIIKSLKYYNRFKLFFKTKSYTLSLLNLLTSTNIGILEKSILTHQYNITSFGMYFFGIPPNLC